MRRSWVAILGGAIAAALAGPAAAVLYDVGGGMVYDSGKDITWLANGDQAPGAMTWSNANTWATNLVYGGGSNWRLPATDIFEDCGSGGPTGFNCDNSELGQLFYIQLALSATDSILDAAPTVSGSSSPSSNPAELFYNVKANIYWSDFLFSGQAWYFSTANGNQDFASEDSLYYAWPVHPGQLGTLPSAMPLPATPWLLGIGLSGLIGWRRRLQHHV